VAETEPRRIWFGRGGCVEEHDDGTHAVFVRGAHLGAYASDDVGSRDVYISVVRDEAGREELARAFRVSPATVGRVVTRFTRGGLQAVADYGRHGGKTARTPRLLPRLHELFEKGLGPTAAHEAVGKKPGYGTVYDIHQQWQKRRLAKQVQEEPATTQAALKLVSGPEAAVASTEAPVGQEPAGVSAAVEPRPDVE
jgi:hypothetical protein